MDSFSPSQLIRHSLAPAPLLLFSFASRSNTCRCLLLPHYTHILAQMAAVMDTSMSDLGQTSPLPVAVQLLQLPLLPGVFTNLISRSGRSTFSFASRERLHAFICLFLTYAYYGVRLLGLHHFWFSIYSLAPTARDSDMENAATSRRTSWTEAINRMQKIWTLIMTVPVVIIP